MKCFHYDSSTLWEVWCYWNYFYFEEIFALLCSDNNLQQPLMTYCNIFENVLILNWRGLIKYSQLWREKQIFDVLYFALTDVLKEQNFILILLHFDKYKYKSDWWCNICIWYAFICYLFFSISIKYIPLLKQKAWIFNIIFDICKSWLNYKAESFKLCSHLHLH